MGRTTRGLLLLDLTVIVLWVVLRFAWFDGTIGCDESMPPQPPNCDTKGDVLAYLGWTGGALFTFTLVWLALRAATTRHPSRG